MAPVLPSPARCSRWLWFGVLSRRAGIAEQLRECAQPSPLAELASLVGQHTRLIWPSHYRLRCIPLTPPTPYPHFLVHRRDDARPQLN